MVRGNPAELVGGLPLGLSNEPLTTRWCSHRRKQHGFLIYYLEGESASQEQLSWVCVRVTQFYCVEAIEILDFFCKYFFSF